MPNKIELTSNQFAIGKIDQDKNQMLLEYEKKIKLLEEDLEREKKKNPSNKTELRSSLSVIENIKVDPHCNL